MRNLAVAAILALLVAAGLGVGYFAEIGGRQSSSDISTSASVLSSSHTILGLELYVRLSSESTGTLAISINETNLLDRVNNVTGQENWPYPNPPTLPCGNYDDIPIQYAILQGVYGQDNFTTATALTLYNTSIQASCPTMIGPWHYILFSPLGDNVTYGSTYGGVNNLVSMNVSESGYWTGSGSTAAFHKFSARSYTVLVEDEWGKVVLLPFSVNDNGAMVLPSTLGTAVG